MQCIMDYVDVSLCCTQTLYEAVCGERNMCSKNLIEARDEITEMKRKLKIMSHQIDQLKEEIAAKVYICIHVMIYTVSQNYYV